MMSIDVQSAALSYTPPRKGARKKMAVKLKEPILVKEIEVSKDPPISRAPWQKPGQFVAIRPVAEEYHDKTYLGLYIGDVALEISVGYDPEAKDMRIGRMTYNPAIFVFDLGLVIFGIESWWGVIQSEADFQQITDLDINNIWYVKALKTLQESKEPANDN
jgi:hypothetical protein